MGKISIEIKKTEASIRKNDIVLFPNGERIIVVDRKDRVLYAEITAYPFPVSKYWIFAVLRLLWIKLRYWFVKLLR
jgi:hypothetical protein